MLKVLLILRCLKDEIKIIKGIIIKDENEHLQEIDKSKKQVKSIYNFIFDMDKNYSNFKKENKY